MTATVNRWHNNPHPALRNSGDDIDRHQRRVATLCQSLAAFIGHPIHNSDLIWAAQHHDEAERVLGDMPGPVKAAFPALAKAYADAEREVMARMGLDWVLSGKEADMLHLCDRLDAYLWATDHCGVTGKKWQDAQNECRKIAARIDLRAIDWMDRQSYKQGVAA